MYHVARKLVPRTLVQAGQRASGGPPWLDTSHTGALKFRELDSRAQAVHHHLTFLQNTYKIQIIIIIFIIVEVLAILFISRIKGSHGRTLIFCLYRRDFARKTNREVKYSKIISRLPKSMKN